MKNKIMELLKSKKVIFFIAFIFMFLFLCGFNDITANNSSGDSIETLEVARTFFQTDKYISYVMYKGIYAFLPSVLFIHLGVLLHIGEMWFFRIFHALAFAYITSIGFPYLIENLFKYKIKPIQKYIFIVLFFILEFNQFVFLTVDFTSLVLLLLGINGIIRIARKKKEERKWYDFVYIGLILGISSCLSGQFGPSTWLLVFYFLYFLFKEYKKKLIVFLCLFLFSFSCMKGLDQYYMLTVVNPARENGAWLPTGQEWLLTGFTMNMTIVNSPLEIPDNLGLAIIEKEQLDLEAIKNGAILYEPLGCVKLFFKYPMTFIMRWTERFFLGSINDYYNLLPCKNYMPKYLFLTLTITVFYLAVLALKYLFPKVKNIFSFQMIVILSFLCSALVPSVGHVENRYYMAFRGLLLAIVCLSGYIPKIVNNLKQRTFKDFGNMKINYHLVMYFLFLMLALLLYFAIYQNVGVDPTLIP